MRPTTLVLCLATLLCCTFLSAASAQVTIGEDDRWSQFGPLGFDDTVRASLTFQGDLIVAGDFVQVQSTTVNRVARWDGNAWSAMGDGFDDTVYDLCEWNGELYAGGYFSFTGSTPCLGVARWNGSAWVEVGGGGGLGVQALAVYGGNLVVAGDFGSVGSGAGEVFAEGVAAYDGTDWIDLDAGLFDVEFGYVADMAVYGTDLYVGGFFLSAGGTGGGQFDGGHVARYDGTGWQMVGGGVLGEFSDPYGAEVASMVVHDGKLYVGGFFTETGQNNGYDGLAAWNGSNWTPGGFLFGEGAVSALGVANGDLYAASFSYLFRETGPGSMFYLGTTYGPSQIVRLDAWGTDLLLAGDFHVFEGFASPGLALFDGTGYSTLGDGTGLENGVNRMIEWNGDLVVGGFFEYALGATGTIGLAAWDGSGWSSLGGGITSATFHAVLSLTTHQGDLIAGGSFTEIGGVSANRVARWDGAAWTPMGAGSVSTVTALHDGNGTLYAHMDPTSGSGSICEWDGANWNVIGSQTLGGDAAILGHFQGQLVAAGQFHTLDGVTVDHIAAWDGTSWSALGGGVSGGQFTRIFGMYVDEANDRLYITGDFTQAGGVPANRLAVWDGTAWSEVGGGLAQPGRDVRRVDDVLYVSGAFTEVGATNVPAVGIAQWDGTDWNPLGSGLDDAGTRLQEYMGRLYVGGFFNTAGAMPSLYLASWDLQLGPTAAPVGNSRFSMLPAAPNPFGERTAIAYELPRTSRVTVDVHDMRGRRVDRIEAGVQPAGRHTFHWSGRDAHGRPVANGTYYLVLRADGSHARSRVTLVR